MLIKSNSFTNMSWLITLVGIVLVGIVNFWSIKFASKILLLMLSLWSFNMLPFSIWEIGFNFKLSILPTLNLHIVPILILVISLLVDRK